MGGEKVDKRTSPYNGEFEGNVQGINRGEVESADNIIYNRPRY